MPPTVPSVEQLGVLLAPHSMESIKSWLKYHGLTHTAASRTDLAKRVHSLMEKGKTTLEAVTEGLIGIEEASGKVVLLLRTEVTPKLLQQLEDQLQSLKTPFSQKRAPVKFVKATPSLVYALNTPDELRMKWAEKQTRVSIDKVHETFTSSPVTKVVVFVLNKKTGAAELRYDKPADKHTHTVDGSTRAQAYFDYYRGLIETSTSLSFESKEIRHTLAKVLTADPPVVVPVTVDEIAEDGGTSRLGHRKKGGDPRQTDNWKKSHQPGSSPKTYESSPMHWIPERTNGALVRETYCAVNGADATVSFRADCYEAELTYVLAQFA